MVRAADGWLFVKCQLPKFWAIMVDKIGHPELVDDPRFRTNPGRLTHRDELTGVLDGIFSQAPVAHWMDLLAGTIPIVPVNGLGEALDNPWLETIAMRETIAQPDREHLAVLANPLKLDGRRLPNRAAPLVGTDSEAILGEVGYGARLRAAGVI